MSCTTPCAQGSCRRRGTTAGAGARTTTGRPSSWGPGEWCLGRVAQIGAGKVFGSFESVMESAFSLGDKFRSVVSAHPCGDLMKADKCRRA